MDLSDDLMFLSLALPCLYNKEEFSLIRNLSFFVVAKNLTLFIFFFF
jgi:hypothetical protein